jgi:cytochrome P450
MSLFKMRFRSRVKQFEGIPGPAPSYPMGTLGEFRGKNPWEVCAGYAEEYGGMTLIWVGGRPTLVLNDPELIRDVLVTKFDDYYKDYPIKALMPVLKNTLFNLNPPEWTELRKKHPCSLQEFSHWLSGQFSLVKQVVDKHLDAMIGIGSDVDILDKLQRMMFDVLNSMICGLDFQDGGFDEFYDLSKMATFRMKMPQCLLLPPMNPTFWRAMKLHYGAYERAVEKAKRDLESDATDLLRVVLRHGTDVSDAQLVAYLSNFQAGGDISSAAGLVNTLHLLNRHPEIAGDLYAQLTTMTDGENNYDLAAMENVPLLDHVLRESLRLIPPVVIYGRNVKKDRSTTLGGREISPNTPVLVVTGPVQRSADRWEDPHTFKPSRWENGVVEANPIGSDYFFPFGRGPRICVGAEMAMFVMKIILASMLSRATVNTSGPFEGVLHCGVIETPKLRAKLQPHPAS